MDAGGSGGRVTRVALANSPRYSWRSRRFDHDVSVPSARLRQSVARRTRSLPPPHVTHDVDEGIDPVLVAVPRQVIEQLLVRGGGDRQVVAADAVEGEVHHCAPAPGFLDQGDQLRARRAARRLAGYRVRVELRPVRHHRTGTQLDRHDVRRAEVYNTYPIPSSAPPRAETRRVGQR